MTDRVLIAGYAGKRPPCLHECTLSGQRTANGKAVRCPQYRGTRIGERKFSYPNDKLSHGKGCDGSDPKDTGQNKDQNHGDDQQTKIGSGKIFQIDILGSSEGKNQKKNQPYTWY